MKAIYMVSGRKVSKKSLMFMVGTELVNRLTEESMRKHRANTGAKNIYHITGETISIEFH